MKKICTLMLSYKCNLNCIYCFEKQKSCAPNRQMTMETAQKCILKELEFVEKTEGFKTLKLDLFGGEPFTRFDFLKSLCDWVWNLKTNVPIEILITTNGTLLGDEQRQWIEKNKERLRVCMSVDGDSDMQIANRGVANELLPVEFIHQCFPRQPFKMTISNETIGNYARGFLSLIQRGYLVDARPATEEVWSKDAHLKYFCEFKKVAKFYLTHPELTPCNYLLKRFNELDIKPPRFCGAGTHMCAYDYDGKPFPCHMFTRIVNGELVEDLYKTYDFENPIEKESDPCSDCSLLYICPTCIGCNYQNRDALHVRDLRRCKIFLAETKVIVAFQIIYYTRLAKSRALTDEEKLTLQRAIPVYQLVQYMKYSKFKD